MVRWRQWPRAPIRLIATGMLYVAAAETILLSVGIDICVARIQTKRIALQMSDTEISVQVWFRTRCIQQEVREMLEPRNQLSPSIFSCLTIQFRAYISCTGNV